MKELVTPFLPPPLDSCWQRLPRVQAAYRALAHMPFSKAMGVATSTRHTIAGVTCFELIPTGTHDPHEAVVLALPFANSMRLDIAWRAWLVQHSLARPRRVIIFPQNAIGKRMFRLSPKGQRTVRRGDFGPIVAKQAEVLKKLGVRRCAIIGYSLGAAVGARLFRELAATTDITVTHVGLFEAPNVMRRTLTQITRAFGQGGWQALNRAITDAKLPPLSALRSLNTAWKQVKDKLAFVYFVTSSLTPVNRAIMVGCTRDRFAADLIGGLSAATPRPYVLIGNAAKSAIMPAAALQAIITAVDKAGFGPLHTITAAHYGHELGDNLVCHTILMCLALEAESAILKG